MTTADRPQLLFPAFCVSIGFDVLGTSERFLIVTIYSLN